MQSDSVTRTIFPVFVFKVMHRVIVLTQFCKLLTKVAILSGGTCLKVPQWHDASEHYLKAIYSITWHDRAYSCNACNEFHSGVRGVEDSSSKRKSACRTRRRTSRPSCRAENANCRFQTQCSVESSEADSTRAVSSLLWIPAKWRKPLSCVRENTNAKILLCS